LADDGQPLEDLVPSLAAAGVASLAGWILDELFEPYLGMGVTLFALLRCLDVDLLLRAKVAGRTARAGDNATTMRSRS
jgi:hypothetical protein